jgi:riboflavin synthase
MFTGIIQSIGKVKSKQIKGGDLQFIIDSQFNNMSDVHLGDSIAMNGVCLTVTQIEDKNISVDVSVETISITDVATWQETSLLNLEKSMTLTDKMGGHMVSGHVDGMAECVSIDSSARSTIYQFKIPKKLDKYIVKKGSITLSGVSLTVNEIEDCILSVNLIPHTLEQTNLGQLNIGDKVNVEIDTIARYVEKMLQNFQI